jgi:hypothetical protein
VSAVATSKVRVLVVDGDAHPEAGSEPSARDPARHRGGRLGDQRPDRGAEARPPTGRTCSCSMSAASPPRVTGTARAAAAKRLAGAEASCSSTAEVGADVLGSCGWLGAVPRGRASAAGFPVRSESQLVRSWCATWCRRCCAWAMAVQAPGCHRRGECPPPCPRPVDRGVAPGRADAPYRPRALRVPGLRRRACRAAVVGIGVSTGGPKALASCCRAARGLPAADPGRAAHAAEVHRQPRRVARQGVQAARREAQARRPPRTRPILIAPGG